MWMTAAILFALAGLAALVAWRWKPQAVGEGVRFAGNQASVLIIRIPIAIMAAMMLAQLIPTELVGSLFGEASGWTGILLATLLGGFLPGGPMTSFPLVLVLWYEGAAVPPIITLITAWSVFAIHRVLVFEVPTMGWRFTAIRLASSLVLPPTAGFSAAAVLSMMAPVTP